MNDFQRVANGWTHNGRRLDGYKLCVWLSDYNLAHKTTWTPATVSVLVLDQFVKQTPKPYGWGEE